MDLRGGSAVAVVLSHLTGGYDSKYSGGESSIPNIWWGAFGVQLFFFISGFVILMTTQRARVPSDFVISRVSRLYPVYWIAVTVSIIVSLAFRVPSTDIGWVDRLMNYTMVQRLLLFDNVDEVYWTLAIEMQFYMLIFALLLVARSRLTTRAVLVAGALWFAVSLAMAIAGAVGTISVSWILHGWIQAVCIAVVASLFLAVVLRRRTAVLRWRPFQFYGRISYSLYIGHAVTGYALLRLIEPLIGRWAGIAVTFAVVTGIAMAYHRIGEVHLSRKLRSALTAVQQKRVGAAVRDR